VQTLVARLEAIDGANGYSAKRMAFNELQPLIWRQLLAQAQSFSTIMAEAHDIGTVSIKDVRADEQLNGWLNVRTHDSSDTQEVWAHSSQCRSEHK
jgi:hypothetical protein